MGKNIDIIAEDNEMQSNPYAEEQAALENARRDSFKKRIEPKVKVIIGKLREVKNLKTFKKALADGAVTQEDIDKIKGTIDNEVAAAMETLEFLRDYSAPAASRSNDKDDIEFAL